MAYDPFPADSGTQRHGGRALPLPSSSFNASARQFVERVFRLRVLGLGAGFFCVAGVFYADAAHPVLWLLLALNGFAWPHLARCLARRSTMPRRAEFRNLIIDSAMGGIWIALMHFTLLPSVLLAVMLAIDKLSVGGQRLLSRALLAQVATCLFASALCRFKFEPQTSMLEIFAALPLLVFYPLAVSSATYRLARTVVRQNRRLAELTRIDAQTGLLNRVAWEELALQELARHQRVGMPAALLMIDIDNFKAVNDLHGQPTGDAAIRAVASIIRRCVRDVDITGRYGGDEFGVVLVHTDIDAAVRIADKIRLTVLAGDPDDMPVGTLTVSIGIAATTLAMHDMRAWIKRADAALLEAKARGRDCVAVAA